jgi:hypothetical protein
MDKMMQKTAKFAVSMPEAEFKKLESRRRKAGKTRSAFVLEAVRAWRPGGEGTQGATAPATFIKEDPGRYGEGSIRPEIPAPKPLTGTAESRKRAMAAAGRFRSETGDLSTSHDEILADNYADTSRERSNDDSPKSRRER